MNIADQLRAVQALPRPRKVRLSPRGKSWLLILWSVWAVLEGGLLIHLAMQWTRTHSLYTAPDSHAVPFYATVFLLLVPAWLSRGWAGEKRLVREGAVAVATVTTLLQGLPRDAPRFEYRFHTDSGAAITGQSVDPTRALAVGETMLVYYDPANSADQIVQCASYYVADAPGLGLDWRDRLG